MKTEFETKLGKFLDEKYYKLMYGMSKEEVIEETNKTFKLNWKEKAALDVFIFAREKGFDPIDITYVLFDGDNHKECKEFLNNNYDNTLNYPNIIEKGIIREVKEGDVILKYNNEYRIL